MRAVACRIQFLGAEIAGHDAALATMLDATVPQLLAEVGVGYVTAAEFYIAGHTRVGAAPTAPTPASAAPPPSTPHPGRPSGTASTGAATANSTAPCTSWP